MKSKKKLNQKGGIVVDPFIDMNDKWTVWKIILIIVMIVVPVCIFILKYLLRESIPCKGDVALRSTCSK